MRMRLLRVTIAELVLLFLTAQPAMADKFISVADIHFDPFAGCVSTKPCLLVKKLRAADYKDWAPIFEEYGEKQPAKVGHDTNYPLFKSTLTELQLVGQKEDLQFGLILGDSLAHTFRNRYSVYSNDYSTAGYQAFVKKTLQFVASNIHQVLPNINIYTAIGNNDSYTGNYNVVPQGKFLQDAAEVWAGLINDKANRNSLLREFPIGGYYTVTLPGNASQRIIVLDTVLFSVKAKGKNVSAAAMQEFAWLHEQLVMAKKQNQHVLLAFHIPVGIDVYTTLQSRFSKIAEFWSPRYTQIFEKELKQFSSVVTEILPGHIHIDTFQLVVLNQFADIPVSFTPSISPIFGNNPGFKIYTYDPITFRLDKFDAYFYPLKVPDAKWQPEYSFNQIYQSRRYV